MSRYCAYPKCEEVMDENPDELCHVHAETTDEEAEKDNAELEKVDGLPCPVNALNHADEDCECSHCRNHPVCASRNGEECDCPFSQECNACGFLLSTETWNCTTPEICGLSCSEICHKKHFSVTNHEQLLQSVKP